MLRSSSVANDLMLIGSFVHDTGLHHDDLPRLTTVLLEHLVYLSIYLVTCGARKHMNSLHYCDNIVMVTDKQPFSDEEHHLHQIHPPQVGNRTWHRTL